ncbi:MAG: hypothetical protein IPH18_03925 [Chitinophagaceae bacterium]|nr:hypothetical protein [Chitinophagaceae bacterium]
MRKLFIALFLFTGLVACKSKSAYNYNHEVLKLEKSLEADIKATENNVERYIGEDNYDSIAVAGKKMEQLVQQKIDIINDKPAPKVKEGDNFKAASLRYFRFIKSMYTGYKELGLAKTEEARETVKDDLRKLIGEKDAAIQDMQSAQKKYAAANGFKVQ